MKILFVCFVCLILIHSSSTESLVGLYGIDDNVTILTGQNFNNTIFESPYIWIVEFYASWCGHCQVFAPTYKALAKDVKDWQRVVRLAVVNCPEADNKDLCRGMNVMSYPTVRIFPPFSNNSFPGEDLEELRQRTVKAYRNVTLKAVEKYLDKVVWTVEEIPKPTFEFASYQDVLDHFQSTSGPYYLAIVFEEEMSEIGKQVILDMSSCNNITTRRINSNSAELKKVLDNTGLKMTEFPSVVVFSRGGEVNRIEVEIQDRSFFTYKLQHLDGVGDPNLLPGQELFVGSKKKGPAVDWRTVDRSKVYLEDIESGLRYALTVEVELVTLMTDDVLDSLKTFIGTLALLSEHIPARPSTRNFLVKLNAWLASKEEVGYKTWQERIKERAEDSYLPETDRRWVGCAPSRPQLRGYPCSLWTMFHSLTVAAYNANEEDITAVPQAIEAYIETFFGCSECSLNFARELLDIPYDDGAKSNRDIVLWLWKLHNNVNKRLHGAVSEDPEFLKVQFPPPDLCPKCRTPKGIWDEEKVFNFLVHRYSSEQIVGRYDDTATRDKDASKKNHFSREHGKKIESKELDEDYRGMDDVQAQMVEMDFDGGNDQFIAAHRVEHQHKDGRLDEMDFVDDRMHPRDLSVAGFGWQKGHRVQLGFTGFDASLCLFLWASSLVGVCGFYCYIKRYRSVTRYCKV